MKIVRGIGVGEAVRSLDDGEVIILKNSDDAIPYMTTGEVRPSKRKEKGMDKHRTPEDDRVIVDLSDGSVAAIPPDTIVYKVKAELVIK